MTTVLTNKNIYEAIKQHITISSKLITNDPITFKFKKESIHVFIKLNFKPIASYINYKITIQKHKHSSLLFTIKPMVYSHYVLHLQSFKSLNIFLPTFRLIHSNATDLDEVLSLLLESLFLLHNHIEYFVNNTTTLSLIFRKCSSTFKKFHRINAKQLNYSSIYNQLLSNSNNLNTETQHE